MSSMESWVKYDNYFYVKFFVAVGIMFVFVFLFVSYLGDERGERLAVIDDMSCGELKEYILETGSRNSRLHAEHRYLWMCEK